MAKRNTGTEVYDVPTSLRDEPFYGLILDEQQKAFRDAIWDKDKLIIFLQCESRHRQNADCDCNSEFVVPV